MELLYYKVFVEPWPWWVSGLMITLVMSLLIYHGKSFGMSANLRTICSFGASKFSDFFKMDWKAERWNLLVAVGGMLAGFVLTHFITPDVHVAISDETVADLNAYGVAVTAGEVPFYPKSIFNWDNLFTWQGFIFIIVGGFLVGFGTRYAGGCTSGHAISGLSNLQLPSLIAVIGFFAGGLITVHFLLPYLFSLAS